MLFISIMTKAPDMYLDGASG